MCKKGKYLNVIWTLYSILTSSILSMLRIIMFTAMFVAASESSVIQGDQLCMDVLFC